MQIGINEDYRVASDSHNVIIEKLQRDKKTGEPCRDKKTGELNMTR